MGLRPFFFASSGGWFFFSNTLEVLRLAPGVASTLDPQFIGDFLLQEWSSDASRTVYKDIHRLPPGHCLKYSKDGLCVHRYTELPIEEPVLLKQPEEYIEQFQSLLEQSVRDRLPKGPCAVFLSGGLDSTSIAAVATKIARSSGTSGFLRAYTIDSRPLFEDEEGILASRVAAAAGPRHPNRFQGFLLALPRLGRATAAHAGANSRPFSSSESVAVSAGFLPSESRFHRGWRGRCLDRSSVALSGISPTPMAIRHDRQDFWQLYSQAQTHSTLAGRISHSSASVDGPHGPFGRVPTLARTALCRAIPSTASAGSNCSEGPKSVIRCTLSAMLAFPANQAKHE